jgi:hypothetical protein
MSRNTIQRLMESTQRGRPIDADMLRENGISPANATYLTSAGWLQRLSKSVYLLKGDSLTRDGILAFLRVRLPGLHVGGKTALAWRGTRHNVAFRERVVLWGPRPYKFPDWVAQHLLFSYQTTSIFDDAWSKTRYIKPLPNGQPDVLVSVPELALLELASDIGKGQSIEEAQNLVESLRNLRPTVLEECLLHCTRIKVVKLVRDLGEHSGFLWGQDLQKHVDRLGAGKRWDSTNKHGERLSLKP